MIKIIALLTLLIIAIPSLAFAQGLVPCGTEVDSAGKIIPGSACTLQDFMGLAVKLINTAIQLAGVVAVLRVVQGGSELASSAAYGNTEQYQVGKTTIVHALLGLAWVLIAYAFVNAIWTLMFPGTFGNTWMQPWR